MRIETLQRRCNKEKKDQTTTNNNKRVPFHKHKYKTTKRVRIVIRDETMKLELSKTQQRKVWPQRGRESTLTALHSCHRPRIPVGHVLIELLCSIKHCKRGCNKEMKDQPTTNNKKVPFQKHKNNKTCEKSDPMKLELTYIQNTQQWKAWPQRGRESTLTAFHRCHRPRIPGGHTLIERTCFVKHCKREGATKKRKTKPTTQTTTNGPVSNHKQKNRTKRVRLVTRRTSRVVVYTCIQQHTTPEGAVATEGVERASKLTGIHPCHRPRIPFRQVLIEHKCLSKNCKKREECNKENKDQNPPHQQQQ
jgi:hypothetical protein